MNNRPIERGALKTGLGPDSDQARWAIREIKAFLYAHRKLIHSLILFGSFALGQARRHSDIDFLVLLKKGEQVRKIKRFLFDFNLSNRINKESKGPVEIQIVSFDQKQIEYLFELSMPLIHAGRHGVVIWDDGWFKTLLSRPYPKWPTREGAVEAFTRWIVWMYFRCAINLKREMLRDHGSEGLCTKAGKCMGHFSGDILARVISRMLYVTLPARGFLPLSKPEAIKMTIEAYGRKACRPVALAMNVLRKERGISYHEFQVLFPLARSLYRECFRICGSRNPKVIDAIRFNASMYKRQTSSFIR